MNVSRARFGLLESKAASLALLRRGQRPVRDRLLDNGRQMRMVALWKRSLEDGSINDALIAAGERKGSKITDKQPALEAYERTTEHVQGRGWGLDGQRRRATPPAFSVHNDEITVSRATTSADSIDQNVSPRAGHADRKTVESIPWGRNTRSSSQAEVNAASVLGGEAGIGWSQATEDGFWQLASRDAIADSSIAEETRYGLSEKGPEVVNEAFEERDTLLDINYGLELPRALEKGDTESVTRCLRAAETRMDLDFIEKIPQETFTEIMRMLGPQRNLGDLLRAAKGVSRHVGRSMGLVEIVKAVEEYGRMLQDTAELRRRSGREMTKEQYIILLESARDLGLRHMAVKLWNMLHQDGIEPDIAMYNALLTAFIDAGRHDTIAGYRERVIKYNMVQRKKKRTVRAYRNFHVGEGGVRERSMVILDAMLKNGITGNEETYCAMITAAAKEGEVATVKSILRTIWHIDVDKLMAPDPESRRTMNPRKPEKGSAQYPSDKLLYALAHGFGINNDIPTALRLVDYISREYEITISQETWQVLFEWTYVLASRRAGTTAREDKKTGQLPTSSLLELWNTMTGPPYFVKPTMSMYNRMISNLLRRNRHVEMLGKMFEALSLCKESLQHSQDTCDMFMSCLEEQNNGREPIMPVTQARRMWEAANVAHFRNKRWMKRWMRFFLRLFSKTARGRYQMQDWIYPLVYHTLPRVLLTWRRYAESYIKYETPTGLVELQFRSDDEMLDRAMKNARFWEGFNKAADQAKFLVGDDWVRHPPLETWRMKHAREAVETEQSAEEAARDEDVLVREAMSNGEPVRASEGVVDVAKQRV